MNAQNIAPWLTFLGVVISLIFTLINTRKINTINRETTLLIEEYRAKGQLRIAAVDRRLKAHKEAFALWRELLGSISTKTVTNSIMKCQTWWDNNCLYLEPKVRQAFIESYASANLHAALVKSQSDSKAILEVWHEFSKFPNILFNSIQLPALTEFELKSIKTINSKPG